MFIDPEKTLGMLKLLEDEHFRYRRNPRARAGEEEVDLSLGLAVELHTSHTPLLSRMEENFKTFLRVCVGVEFADASVAARRITFSLDGSAAMPRDESFTISVSEHDVSVTAPGERGLLHASHYIERLFALRGGPFLRKGRMERKPFFNPRISQTVFTMADGSVGHPTMLTDAYLSLMSHFGINGVHVYASLWDYSRSATLPDLDAPDYEENTARLREICERASRHGIDVYLVVRTEALPESAPVFAARPDVRGSRINFPVPGDRYCLCSSHPDVLRFYREAFTNLVSAAPILGGVILIVGGEGFMHCFTRPKPPLAGGTSCPHCAGKYPSEVVAGMMNVIGDTVRSENPSAMVFAWPYSAFAWSGKKDPSQTEFVRRLNGNVSLLSTFETPFTYRLGGVESVLIDYNIVNIGPSEQFAEQTEVLKDKGLTHYAKFESSTEPGWFFLPYLPVHYRWIDRVRSMRQNGVAGFVAQWRFYGFTGSLPEEILSEWTWEDQSPDEMLLRIAGRDFGDVSETILKGWRILSDTWEKIPSSHMLFGEREFYMKGPLYLGPAHPLIFDSQKRYGLSRKFFTLRGDRGEFVSKEEIAEMESSAPPRYSSDLLFVYPFGLETAESAFSSALEEWNSGIEIIADAVGDAPSPRAVMELDICRTIGTHLRSTRNVIRFYKMRDDLFSSPGKRNDLDDAVLRLTAVLDDEIENAESILPVLERDLRIGYGHCYGQVYDAEMVREKIHQCLYVRDVELPELKSGIAFHIYNEYTTY